MKHAWKKYIYCCKMPSHYLVCLMVNGSCNVFEVRTEELAADELQQKGRQIYVALNNVAAHFRN